METNGHEGDYASRLTGAVPGEVARTYREMCEVHPEVGELGRQTLAKKLIEASAKSHLGIAQTRNICIETLMNYVPHPGPD